MPVRANAVEVDKLFRAHCKLPGCGWTGQLRPSYREANDEREGHLYQHRLEESASAGK